MILNILSLIVASVPKLLQDTLGASSSMLFNLQNCKELLAWCYVIVCGAMWLLY